MADLKYTEGKILFADPGVDLTDISKMKVMLVDSTYVAAAVVGDNFATAQAGEITGTNYVAGGKALANITATESPTDSMMLDADNTTWANSTITARGAVLYNDDTANTVIALYDFTEDKVSSAGDFTINWNVLGLLTIT